MEALHYRVSRLNTNFFATAAESTTLSSPSVEITRVIGPLISPGTKAEADMAEDLPNLALSPAVEPRLYFCDFLSTNASLLRILMPNRHAITVLYYLREDINDEYIYFQVILLPPKLPFCWSRVAPPGSLDVDGQLFEVSP